MKSKQKLETFDSTLFVKSNREPVDELDNRHKADSEAESTNATHVRNEVQPSHLWGSLKL